MSIFIRVPVGIAIMIVGFLMVWKTETVLEWFGRVDWAEDKFGPGGSRFFWKLVGVLIIFIGIFVATNIISDILTSFAGIFVRT
jgi:uncharacterized membrane protein